MEGTEEQQGGSARQVLVQQLPGDEDAPRRARELLEEAVSRFTDQIRANLHVAVSELVTNAVVHGAPGEVGLRVIVQEDRLRVEVSDDGVTPFKWQPDPGSPEGGWGLHLVDKFTDRCGVERRPNTVTWCELDIEPRATG
jgi:anti-sigma regulatory factor (Ser/Thr protein kinase)